MMIEAGKEVDKPITRLRLGADAFAVGAATVAVIAPISVMVVFGLAALINDPGSLLEDPQPGFLLPFYLVSVAWSLILTLVLGVPAGALCDLVLRRVTDQRWHVAVFGLAGAGLVFALFVGTDMVWGLSVATGLSAAIGRHRVRKRVQVKRGYGAWILLRDDKSNVQAV